MKTRYAILALAALSAVAAHGLEIESGPSAPEKRAEAELRYFISLLAEETPDLRFRIGVKFLDEFPSDKAFLGDWDGYAVRRKDGFIYIVSPQPRGCLFGVYDFLERNSDIIWARPTEEYGTIYTRTKTFEAREADFVEKPVFQMRGWWFCGPQRHAPSEYWHARVRCNFGCCNQKHKEVLKRAIECGYSIGGASGHNLPGFMPDSEFDVHPEYFAEINGVRRRDKNKTQFCFSNMDGAAVVGSNAVLQIAEKLAKMKASSGVEFDHWALKQADNQRVCECAECLKDIPLGGGRVSRKDDVNFRSNQIFRYLNRAIEPIEAAYPEMRVDTFAYQFSAPPPDVKVHEKFNVAFCPFIKNDRVPVTNSINAVWAERAEKWSKATKNVMWREYWGDAGSYPRQNSLVAVHDLRWINSALGFTRVYSETHPDMDNRRAKGKGLDYRPDWDGSAMEHWVISRLMWNPYVPVEKYREEYIRRTYRRAAAPMREFYALLAQSWFSDDAPSNYCDDPYGNAARYIKGAGIDKRLLELLDEALRLAEGDMPAAVGILKRQAAHFRDLIANCSSSKEPLTVPLVTDGDWSKAAVIEGFEKVTIGGGRNAKRLPAEWPTKVLLCHDMKNLKVKFVCDGQDPARLEAKDPSAFVRETFPGGDHVEFAITTGKGRHTTHFAVDWRGNRADLRDGDYGFNAKWKVATKKTATGYEVEAEVDFESIGAEITQENRYGACFVRMAMPSTPEGKREFSSWGGMHPKASTIFNPIFISMEGGRACAPKTEKRECPHWISVMPLNADNIASVSADAAMLGDETIVDGIAWSFPVHPVGRPVEDKASHFAARYREAEKIIRARSKVKLGILLQATMGHGGEPSEPADFPRVVKPDGSTLYRMCPLDEGFLAYIAAACRTFSAVKPAFFMVDDDTRLVWGTDIQGCFCPRHLAEFAKRTGREWTREEVVASFSKDRKVREAWTALTVDSLSGLFRTIRDGFDKSIPGMICVCATPGHIEYARRYAEILAAPGQRPTIRGNGAPFHNYGKDPLHIVEMRSRYARQLATIGEGAVLLQEADTCPHTLWMCSATRLFDHMVMLALDGVKGAKIWITRTSNNHEQRSGRNYRRIFRENRGLMQWAADVDFRQHGVVVPPCGPDKENFGDLYLGLIGVPYRFGKARPGEIVALTAATLERLSASEIDEIMAGRVILDGTAAIWLSAHGRSADTGVEAVSWKLKTVQLHEFADGSHQWGLRVNSNTADLTRYAKGAKVLSRLCARPTMDAAPVFVAPGAVEFANARGGRVFTLAQPLPPIVPISYAQTFLSETYKRWFIGLLRELGGGLPGGAYYLGDGPATFLSGTTEREERVVVLNLLDLDGDEAPEIVFDEVPSVLERLRGDGGWERVSFVLGDGGSVRISSLVKTQTPAIFRIKKQGE